MLAVTATNVVHSELPIFHYAVKHFEWYMLNDASNVNFQFFKRSWSYKF